MLPGRRKRRVAEQVAANHNPQSQVSRNSTMLSEPGLLTLPEVRASVDDTIQGGTDVLEVWFAGCHSGKFCSQFHIVCFPLLPFTITINHPQFIFNLTLNL